MEEDHPYRAEYAKSSRAKCKGCKLEISKDSLRLAAMVQSPMFDGKIPNWYHFMCFFSKQRPKTETDIAHFDSLRWEDQEKIKNKIANAGSQTTSSSSGGKSKKKGGDGGALLDYNVEYAKSGRAMCRGCEQKIMKDEVRIGKKDYDSESSKMYGPKDLWHHVDCFVKNREELEFFESGERISGFFTLSADDKKMVRNKLRKIDGKRKAEDEPDQGKKKIKTEDKSKDDSNDLQKQQSKKIFYYRDKLATLNKKQLQDLLDYNGQDVPSGESRMLDRLADQMVFGSLERCDICTNGTFAYESGKGYVCNGNLTEWTKCTNITVDPKRKTFKIPKEYKEIPFLNQYKGAHTKLGKRHVNVRPASQEMSSSQNGRSKMSNSNKPLEGMEFVIEGKFKKKSEMKDTIHTLGGTVVSSVKETTAAVITTKDCVNGMTKKVTAAKSHNVQCVSEDFLEEVKKGGALLMIQKKNICAWGGDPQDRVFSEKKTKEESRYTAKIPDKQKMKLKGGAAVDPDSEIDDIAHVYQRGKKIYNSVLNLVDVNRGINSYYKLQLLESDNNRRWWIFRSWGRIGTIIGNNKLEEMEDLNDALRLFNALYEEKTMNRFNQEDFIKHPGKFFPLDIDYGDTEEIPQTVAKGSKSKLHKSIQELVSLIFDVETMKSAMVEFEIDLKKMPLGKLSKKQIQQAYSVLSDALKRVKNLEETKPADVKVANAHILDCSNRFFTLIPHDFGMRKPPLLDNEDLINLKIAMLDNLSEIELAYNLLKSEDEEEMKQADPLDKYYKKLKTDIGVIDKSSDTFKMIEKYVKNTHAQTHNHYELEIEEVFTIARDKEEKRFKPFKKLHNRQLLWHGSRLTNFAGILSQGLRIAPPEAPVTGYMFGKGIYFADMVSKSANYCATSSSNPTGLLLLCDVALGDMYEKKRAEYIEKLPKGKHSTKGLGSTHPDPKDDMMVDGYKVPVGKGVAAESSNYSLLYNEYIVYDVAQVNIKYLIKTNFKYKY